MNDKDCSFLEDLLPWSEKLPAGIMNDKDCSFLEDLLPWSEKLPAGIRKA